MWTSLIGDQFGGMVLGRVSKPFNFPTPFKKNKKRLT